MHSVSFQHASAVGIPSKVAWSTTTALRFGSGELIAAMSFVGNDQSPHDGRRFVSALSDSRDESQFSAASVYQKIRTLLSELSEETFFSAAFLWCQEDTVTIFCFGHASVALQRREQWKWLCSGEESEKVLQGSVRPGDMYALFTGSAQSLHSVTQHIFQDADMAATSLMPGVNRLEEQSEVAVVFVQKEDLTQNVPSESARTASWLQKPVVSKSDSHPDEEVEETSESAATETPEDSFSPTSQMTNNTEHLISPARLSQGVAAATIVQPRGKIPVWWKVFRLERRFQWPEFRVLRVAILLAVVGAVLGGVMGVREWRVRSEYSQVVLPLETAVSDLQSYPESERFEQRDKAQSLLERLQATRVQSSSNQRKLNTLIDTTQKMYAETAAETRLVSVPLFFDFRLVQPNFLSSRASIDRTSAVFLDTSQSLALSLDVRTKRTETIQVPSVNAVLDAVSNAATFYWLTPENVTRTTGDETTVLHSWAAGREPKFLERYGSNLYVLDTGSQQIWRLDADTAGSPSAWIRSARGIDVRTVSSMSIDGEIWLGTRSGDVYRLRQGSRQDFVLKGLQEPFSSTLLTAVTTENQILAVAEPTKQRVVFIDKSSGEYLRQIHSAQIGAVTDLFWDTDGTTLYLVAGSLVYSLSAQE